MLAQLRFDAGTPDAVDLATHAYDFANAAGDPVHVKEATLALAHVLVWSCDIERARLLLEAEYRASSERDEHRSAEARWYLSFVELRAGRWSLASEYADHARRVVMQYESELPQPLLPVSLIAVHRGEAERACQLSQDAVALAEERGLLVPLHVSISGLAALWAGEPAKAVPWFARAEETADAAGIGEPNMRSWTPDHVEALLELGQIDAAAELLDEWETRAATVGRDWALAEARRCRGLASAAAGDVECAIQLLEEAVVEHEGVGDPFGMARALLALGVVRRRARQKRPAREAIEAALQSFETLGAAGWAKKARSELGRIGGRSRAEGLTAAEQRVAALVVEGRTNREVAAALFLAEPTVASHLSRVYTKLGVRSRTELARKLQPF
jgi:DNA-binding CsgD family transcriptional regulator